MHEAREGLAEAVGGERVSCRQGIASGEWVMPRACVGSVCVCVLMSDIVYTVAPFFTPFLVPVLTPLHSCPLVAFQPCLPSDLALIIDRTPNAFAFGSRRARH